MEHIKTILQYRKFALYENCELPWGPLPSSYSLHLTEQSVKINEQKETRGAVPFFFCYRYLLAPAVLHNGPHALIVVVVVVVLRTFYIYFHFSYDSASSSSLSPSSPPLSSSSASSSSSFSSSSSHIANERAGRVGQGSWGNNVASRLVCRSRGLGVDDLPRSICQVESKKPQLWDPNVRPECGTQMWDPNVGPKCGTQMWDPNMRPKCGTQMRGPMRDPMWDPMWDPNVGPNFFTDKTNAKLKFLMS